MILWVRLLHEVRVLKLGSCGHLFTLIGRTPPKNCQRKLYRHITTTGAINHHLGQGACNMKVNHGHTKRIKRKTCTQYSLEALVQTLVYSNRTYKLMIVSSSACKYSAQTHGKHPAPFGAQPIPQAIPEPHLHRNLLLSEHTCCHLKRSSSHLTQAPLHSLTTVQRPSECMSASRNNLRQTVRLVQIIGLCRLQRHDYRSSRLQTWLQITDYRLQACADDRDTRNAVHSSWQSHTQLCLNPNSVQLVHSRAPHTLHVHLTTPFKPKLCSTRAHKGTTHLACTSHHIVKQSSHCFRHNVNKATTRARHLQHFGHIEQSAKGV